MNLLFLKEMKHKQDKQILIHRYSEIRKNKEKMRADPNKEFSKIVLFLNAAVKFVNIKILVTFFHTCFFMKMVLKNMGGGAEPMVQISRRRYFCVAPRSGK